MVHSPQGLIRAANLSLLLTRTDLPALAAARQWASEWTEAAQDGTGAASVATLLVGAGRPYDAAEVAKVLAIPVLESLAWDPRSARVFSEGQKPSGGAWSQRDLLVRSYRAAAAAINQRVTADRLAVSPGGSR